MSAQRTTSLIELTLTFLERHYSYECKTTTQERPYTSRPSRSQQLRNPKLVPKLANDSLAPLAKKGAADEELAKKEAERARKRQRDELDNKLLESEPKRRRSASLASVSSISTRSSTSGYDQRDQKRDAPSQLTRSPPPGPEHSQSRYAEESRSISRSRSRSRSPTPPLRNRPFDQHAGHNSRRRGSTPPRGRNDSRRRRTQLESDEEQKRYQSPKRSPVRGVGRDDRDSPDRHGKDRREFGGRWRGNRRGHRGGRDGRGFEEPVERPNRERSLSPFSKRKAMSRYKP